MPLPSHSRRVLVIFNPTAGARRRRRLNRVLKELERRGCAVATRATRARGDAERFARDADPASFDLVAVAGGDGTINEAINGLADSGLPLAPIPLGTANVLAHELGMHFGARQIAQAIAAGQPRPVYLGQANGRRFAMMLGIGIDARIVAGVDLRLKRFSGKLAYVLSGLRAVINYRPARYRVEIDGRSFTAAGAIVAKGHFYAGRFVAAPDARLDAPSFHVVLMARPGRWNVLRYGLAIALGRAGRLPDMPVIEGRRIVIHGPDGEAVQADGDVDGALPLDIQVSERPLPVIG